MNTLVVWLLALGVGVSSLVASRSLIHYFQLESYQFAGYFRTLKRNFLRAMTPGTIMTVYLLLLLLIHRSIDRRFHDGSVFCIFVAIVTLALALLGGMWCRSVMQVKKAKKPVIFFHGESDDFVPCWMSEKMYEACASRKRLVKVPGAGHGLAFPVDQEGYLKAAREFFGSEASAN